MLGTFLPVRRISALYGLSLSLAVARSGWSLLLRSFFSQFVTHDYCKIRPKVARNRAEC